MFAIAITSYNPHVNQTLDGMVRLWPMCITRAMLERPSRTERGFASWAKAAMKSLHKGFELPRLPTDTRHSGCKASGRSRS